MDRFFNKYKKVLIAVAISICLIVLFFVMFNFNLEGYFVDYEKADENDGHTVYASSIMFINYEYKAYKMTNEQAQDIVNNPEKYTAYWVEIYLKNNSLHTIYYLEADIKKEYTNMWFDTSSLHERALNLKPFEEFEDSRVLVIVRTENMTEKDIDQLIRSLEISIYARNIESIDEYRDKTIGFASA